MWLGSRVTPFPGRGSCSQSPACNHVPPPVKEAGLTRRGVLAALPVSLGLSLAPRAAEAFCGEPYPSWAYSLPFNEGGVKFSYKGYRGDIFLREVGDEGKAKKAKASPILVVGSPGYSHDYLETIEATTNDDHVVYLFDPVGAGQSSKAQGNDKVMLQTPASMQAQLDTIVKELGLKQYHLLGHGVGGAVALERAANKRGGGPKDEKVLSLTLASPILGSTPSDYLEKVSKAYGEREKPVPVCLETSIESAKEDDRVSVPGEQVMTRAEEVQVPTFITYGERDIVSGEAMNRLKQSLSSSPSVGVVQYSASGHMAHLDEREQYLLDLINFLRIVEGRNTEA